jgi:hypothetical protein
VNSSHPTPRIFSITARPTREEKQSFADLADSRWHLGIGAGSDRHTRSIGTHFERHLPRVLTDRERIAAALVFYASQLSRQCRDN